MPGLRIAIAAGAILVAVVVALFVRQLGDDGTRLRSTPSVVVAVRDLARLRSTVTSRTEAQ